MGVARIAGYDGLDAVASVVDRSTGYLGACLAAGLIGLALLRFRRTGDALRTVVAVALACLGNAVLKELVERPRPATVTSYDDVSPYSFPSGHAAATAALAVAVVLVAWTSRWRGATVVAGALLVVVAATAQLLLGRHHVSDLVAGWLWGGAAAAAVWKATTVRA